MNEFPSGGGASVVPNVSPAEEFFPKINSDATWTNSWTLVLNPAAGITTERITYIIPRLEGHNYPFLQEMKLKLRMRLLGKDKKLPNHDGEDDDSVSSSSSRKRRAAAAAGPDETASSKRHRESGGLVETSTVKDDPKPVKVTRSDIAPINNFANSLFNNVKLYLNETQVSSGNNGLYPYWAYLNALVNNTTDRKRGLMQLYGYYEDTSWDTIDEREPLDGWSNRRNLFGHLDATQFVYKDRVVTVYADVMTEFKGTHVPMLNLVGGRLELYLNRPGFYLQCSAHALPDAVARQYSLHLEAAELMIPIKTMNATLSQRLEARLMSQPTTYHTVRMDMRKLLIPKGNSTFCTDNIKQTLVSPDRVMLFLLPDHFIDSDYGTSAFNLQNYIGTKVEWRDTQHPPPFGNHDNPVERAHLTSVKLALNNESLESTEGGNTEHELALRKMLEFYQNQGMVDSETACRIGINAYKHGKFIMLYDLTKAKRAALSGPLRQEAKEGSLKLELTFDKMLPVAAFLMVVSEFHSAVTVDKNRNVIYQYSS